MNIKGILQLLFRKWKPIWKAIRMMEMLQREYTFLKTRSEDGQSGEDTEEETAEESTEE